MYLVKILTNIKIILTILILLQHKVSSSSNFIFLNYIILKIISNLEMSTYKCFNQIYLDITNIILLFLNLLKSMDFFFI